MFHACYKESNLLPRKPHNHSNGVGAYYDELLFDGSKVMVRFVSFKLKQTINWIIGGLRSNSTWSSAIKNAPSPYKALEIYTQMHRQIQSIPSDKFSVLYAMKSCSKLHDLPILHHFHAHIYKLGFTSNVYIISSLLHGYASVSLNDARYLFDEMPHKVVVTWNTMITCLSRLGYVEDARSVFEKMPLRNLVSWSAMIAGYMDNNYGEQGVSLFRKMMMDEMLQPDEVTLISIAAGCGQMGSSIGLVLGKSIHGFAIKNDWQLNVALGTVLVDMYAKCGFLKNACLVFDRMQDKNIISWTALICGLAQHGQGEKAITLFEKMKERDIRPNEFTFTGILSACVQAGLVEEGRRFFNMIFEYGLEPRIQHYGCIVDLLGKAGEIGEAFEVIKTMDLEPNVHIWSSFLSSCKLYKQFEMAEGVIDRVLEMLKPESNGGVYNLICDLYAMGEKWDDVERVRRLMINQNVRKARGSSFI